MKPVAGWMAWGLACALATTGCGATQVPARLGAFSFDYLLAGEGAARPVQVFDDGRQTFLQYRPGLPVPVLLSAQGQQLFLPRQHGPYVVIDAVPRDFVAQLGGSRVRITHARIAAHARGGPGLPADVTRKVAAESAETETADAAGGHRWTENSYATPARGDRIEWREPDEVVQDFTLGFPAGQSGLSTPAARLLRAKAGPLARASRVEVVAREDVSLKEGVAAGRAAAVADQLVAAGVPRARIGVRVAQEAGARAAGGEGVAVSAFAARVYAPPPAPRPAPRVPRFQLRAADGTLAANLQRWASGQGWRLVLQGAPEVQVVGDAELPQTDFLAAAEYAIAQAREAGYAIRAAAYANQVFVLQGDTP